MTHEAMFMMYDDSSFVLQLSTMFIAEAMIMSF